MTYSVAALDPSSGHLLVAVQSYHPAVGAVVPHLREGVGAVLTQARGEPRLAEAILDLLARGGDPLAALDEVLARDPRAEERQLVVLSQMGVGAGWTGGCCVPFAGHHVGDGYVLAANLAATPEVMHDMAAVMASADQSDAAFGGQLFRALAAGQRAGGDLRGLLSAAFLAGAPTQAGRYGRIEARIDVSDSPLVDLERAVRELCAFHLVKSATDSGSHLDVPQLINEVRSCTHDGQTLFWLAMDVLAHRYEDFEAAARLLSALIHDDPRWGEVLDRIPTVTAARVRERLDDLV